MLLNQRIKVEFLPSIVLLDEIQNNSTALPERQIHIRILDRFSASVDWLQKAGL